jgi:hypothetical protein
MEIVRDDSDKSISALQEVLLSVAPDLASCKGLRLVLPRELGGLKKPEFMHGIKTKMMAIKDLQKSFEEGALSEEDLHANVIEILSRG